MLSILYHAGFFSVPSSIEVVRVPQRTKRTMTQLEPGVVAISELDQQRQAKASNATSGSSESETQHR